MTGFALSEDSPVFAFLLFSAIIGCQDTRSATDSGHETGSLSEPPPWIDSIIAITGIPCPEVPPGPPCIAFGADGDFWRVSDEVKVVGTWTEVEGEYMVDAEGYPVGPWIPEWNGGCWDLEIGTARMAATSCW